MISSVIRTPIFANATIALALIKLSIANNSERWGFTYLPLSISIPNP
jgi:hypothetical protein